MTVEAGDVTEMIRGFVLREFLQGESESELTDDVELMTLGVLDSVGVLKLVGFLEERFDIAFAPHELGKEYLNTICSITALVASKLAGPR